MTIVRSIIPLIALASLTACERKPIAAPAQGPAPTAVQAPSPVAPLPAADASAATPAEPGAVFIGSLSFVRDERWSQQPPASKMRLAEFSTEDGCAIVVFDDLGAIKPGETPTDDMVKANLDRWTSQVAGSDGSPAAPTIETHQVGGLDITCLESTGTYQDGMPGGPKTPRTDTTFRGMVIRTPSDLYFIRMIGPKSAMEGHADAWKRMRETMRVH